MTSSEFEQTVIKWLQLDDKAKELTKAMKDIKLEKKECETKILSYMGANDTDVLELSSGNLRKSVSSTKGALKQEYIHQALIERVKDPQDIECILNSIVEKRAINQRTYLKRCNKRGSVNKEEK